MLKISLTSTEAPETQNAKQDTQSDLVTETQALWAGIRAGNLNPFMYGGPQDDVDPVRGGALFDALCDHQDYYLRKAESTLLTQHMPKLCSQIQDIDAVIEFGPGSAYAVTRKTIPMLKANPQITRYIAVDRNQGYLDEAVTAIRSALPNLKIESRLSSFMDCSAVENAKGTLALMLGNTIGNFEAEPLQHIPPQHPVKLVSHIRHIVGDRGKFLVGVDCLQNQGGLLAAYDNPAAHAWSENLLHRMRRDAGVHLDIQGFYGQAIYDTARCMIQLGVVSRREQIVRVGNKRFIVPGRKFFSFFNSYKYPRQMFELIAEHSGFTPKATYAGTPETMVIYLLQADS